MNILEYAKNRLSTIGIDSKVGPIFVEYEFHPNDGIYCTDMQLEGLLFLVKDSVTEDELSQIFSWKRGEDPIKKIGAHQIVISKDGKYIINPDKKIIGVYKMKELEVESGRIVINLLEINPKEEWEKYQQRCIEIQEKAAE